jgi:hypothetical protein
MRCFLFLLVFIFLSDSPVSSQIVVNEIYYDHPGRDGGYEFVELMNFDDVPRALAGCTLEFHDGSSDGWRVIWASDETDTIGGGALFVIGGSSVLPLPNRVIELGLQNGPDAVRVVVGGVEGDRVGYGALSDGRYFERQSAPDVSEGESLGRYPDGHDTDDNAADFRALEPSPGRFNQPRRNVVLMPAGDTPIRRAIEVGEPDVVRVFVGNRGLEPVAAGAVAVEVIDSTELFATQIDRATTPHVINAGDSIELEFMVTLSSGYHHVTLFARYDDERPGDNGVVLLRRVGRPPLLISEVMSLPAVGCPEYVELFNTGATAYHLVDHWVRDRAHEPIGVGSLSRMIPPGAYAVITEDESLLLGCFSFLDTALVTEVEGGWPSLNHTGAGDEADSVVVLDRFLLPVDRVAYPPQSPDSRGRSLERVDLYAGDRPHSWLLSTSAGGGSPGRHHEQVVFETPRHEAVLVGPNPFDPSSGQAALITVSARGEPSRATVQIFDVVGRRVCEVGSSTSLPFVFLWDGRDGRGRLVAPGIYIVACELHGLGTGSRTVEKVVLGCGRQKQ